ncbi:D-lactate dehydrogenase [Oecophyllibacter saccharovorans]|uniref:Quinone-dependent D-lactate dehydrogenase n=1 Tax=Oecophyllibacter saccharovorans TaxID=2558360 RepID=A0A506UL82_9PROT|nr:D-lactate dehydrogenase [Oecophyllibacter saccharovorans]
MQAQVSTDSHIPSSPSPSPVTSPQAPPVPTSDLLAQLRQIVGAPHLHTSEQSTYRYRKGFRFGNGPVEAVVLPGNLVELWQVAQACVQAGRILIMQAANTGLTGGSTPDGSYDRPVVLINTRRLKGIHLLGDGKQVVCLPGSRLHELEALLAPLGREPHSVIGSSCLGASVLGGVSNNSGGALVQRGPAFTQMALFGQVNAQGKLELVNHLGIKLPGSPEEILRKLEAGTFSPEDIDWHAGAGHDANYIKRVRDVEADTPARYNADPEQLYEASGNAGRLVVFAVRLDTFPATKNSRVFYIGSNSTETLEKIRHALLTKFDEIPIAGEYLHRDIFDIADRYGRDTTAIIRLLGTKYLPLLFDIKARVDALGEKYPFIPRSMGDRTLQFLSRFLPRQVPPRIEDYHKRYEHHLLVRTSPELGEKLAPWLEKFFASDENGKDGGFFECTPQEGNLAFLHRFAAAGAAERYVAIHREKVGGIVALDIALRRNDRNWFEHLPKAIADKLELKLYYGHFLCHVLHQDYVVKKGYDPMEVKAEMLVELNKRGARYPAEHNVGHLYHAPEEMVDHYRKLDPCNCLNPGIGKTTKLRNWRAESA